MEEKKEKWEPKYTLWEAFEIYAKGIRPDDSPEQKEDYVEAIHTMRREITRAVKENPEETKELAKRMTPWRAE